MKYAQNQHCRSESLLNRLFERALCELMPYLAAIATKEWCFKEERVLNTMLLEYCILCQNVSLLWSIK